MNMNDDAQSGGIDEGRRRAFETSWVEGRPEAIERHLPAPDSPSFRETLEELVCIELEFAWKRCSREVAVGHGSFLDAPRIEAYVERFPVLGEPEILARLAAEEHRIRCSVGDQPTAGELRTRFPELGSDDQGDASDAGAAAHETASPGEFAGRYVLTAEHARGGMGAVWRASDRKLGREVAVKQLNDALSLRGDYRRRFLTEARVTARLEHPGIVPVYDLSGPGEEHDYYAMKLVRGETLAAAIDAYHRLDRTANERPLAKRRLVDAFLTVCRTMEYAHARGVIHRDLKPQNIVLGNYGETIVLDWGLAKDLSDPHFRAPETAAPAAAAASDVTATMPGTVQGTPAYMAPEQAEGRTEDVDTRSDVYALGVILYQLLTGRVPYSAEKVEALSRLVIAGHPQKPRALDPGIPRALEAICLTAMALERKARYPRVADLTRDLQRHLADEPVSVWAEPWALRARRWMRRHRTAVTGAAVAVIVAVIGLTVLAFVLTAANARERRAREAEAEQRRLAEANFAIARDAVDRYFTQVSEDTRLRARGLENLRRDLLLSARDFFARLAEQEADDPALEMERGHTLVRLAMITSEVGTHAEAKELLVRARDLFTELSGRRPDDPFVRLQVARIENRLGGVHLTAGHVAEAEQHLKACLAITVDLSRDGPGMTAADSCEVTALQNLAGVYRSTRRLEEAEEAFRRALEVQERRVKAAPENVSYRHIQATMRLNLALVVGGLGRLEEAVEEAEAALALADQLVQEAPNEPVYATFRAKVQSDLGVCYRQADRLADARATLERAVSARETLARIHPDVPGYVYDAAQTRLNLANVMLDEGDADAAAASVDQVVKVAEELLARAPDNIKFTELLAFAHYNLGGIHSQAQRFELAESHLTKAAGLDAKAAAGQPTALGSALRAAQALLGAGDYAAYRGEQELAAARYQRAIEVLEACGEAAAEQPAVKAQIDQARAKLTALPENHEEPR